MNSNQTKPIRPHFGVGRIVHVNPHLNVYQIEPYDQFATGVIQAIDTRPSSMSTTGIIDASSYPVDTDVFYFNLVKTDEHELGQELLQYSYIIGAAPVWNIKSTGNNPVNHIFSSRDNFNDPVTDMFATAVAPQANQNRSFGRPADATPGEFLKMNYLGGRMHMGNWGLDMSTGHMNGIFLDQLTHSMRTSYINKATESPLTQCNDYIDLENRAKLTRSAATLNEALGAYSDTAFERDIEAEYEQGGTGIYKLKAEDQQGIFRMLGFEGSIVNGRFEAVIQPEEGSAVRTISKSNLPHLPLSAEHITYDGEHNIYAAKRVSLNRSVYIPVPRELKDEQNTEGLSDIEIPEPAPDVYNSVDADIKARSQDFIGLLKDEKDTRTVDRHFNRMKARTENWKFYDKDEAIATSESSLQSLSEDEQGYGQDATEVEVNNLNSDETMKLKALLSAVELTEDGAVLLHDGHGSEVRMHRGNITITCPGDLKQLPGRDHITMAPRTYSVNAGKLCELGSNNGDVSVKAEKNLTVLGGNSGQGYTLIESRSTAKLDATGVNYANDSISGGGLLIKSKSDLGAVGKDVRFGLYNEDNSPSGIDGSSATGTMILDTGNGTLGILSNSLYGNFKSGITLSSVNNGKGSLLNLQSSSMTLSAETLNLGAGIMKVGKVSGKFDVVTVDKDGPKRESFSPAANDNSVVSIGGDLEVTKNVTVNANIQTNGVQAERMFANNAGFRNASRLTGMRIEKDVTVGVASSRPIVASGVNSAAQLVYSAYSSVMTRNSMFTGGGVMGIHFAYSLSGGYKTFKHKLVQNRWQAMLGDSARIWKNKSVADINGLPSNMYPGALMWTDETYVQGIESDEEGTIKAKRIGSLAKKYYINTDHE